MRVCYISAWALKGIDSLPIPNHNGVPNTNALKDNFPRSDAASIVDLKTNSSVNGPYHQSTLGTNESDIQRYNSLY